MERPLVGVQSQITQWTYATRKTYTDPFNDIDIDVVLTMAGQQWRVPGYWQGSSNWGVRFAPPLPGTYRYHVECTDKSNPDLNGNAGELVVSPYSGDNPLLLHGVLRVSANRRYFEHADGTPFLWLGDTCWKGLCKRLTWAGFQKLIADRKAKGFNVLQIVAGTYPDESPFDPRWQNEAGMPYEPGYERINPAYFDYADRRIKLIVDSGIVPAIFGGWQRGYPPPNVARMTKHWRYLVARYGAYPTVWSLVGEADDIDRTDRETLGKMTDVAQYVRSIDPSQHLITLHAGGNSSGRLCVSDDTSIDFDMLQTSHADWQAAPVNASMLSTHRSKQPTMPVLIGEANYESHLGVNHQDVQRFNFWMSMTSGAAGYTYGAAGIYAVNTDTVRGSTPVYDITPWDVAMDLPGSTQIGIGKRILERYPWWQLEPHPEWVRPYGEAFHEQPYAAGIPGELIVVFLPGPRNYHWTGPTLHGLDRTHGYRGMYVDPATGKIESTWTVAFPSITTLLEERSIAAASGSWVDCAENTVTLLKDREFDDITVSVGVNADVDAGIVLRYHDPDNYLVALYGPSGAWPYARRIYMHDRVDGSYGPVLGTVSIPAIGPHFRLTADVSGGQMQVAISDGIHSYSSQPVQVKNVKPGPVGVWRGKTGGAQEFDDFLVSSRLKSEADDPAVQVSLTDPYAAPPLPAPQDWVLILERLG